MSDERLDELIALAALGELDAAGEAELDALLAHDANAAAQHRDAVDTAADLQSAHAAAPPEHLRASVLRAIGDEAQAGAAVPPVTSLDAARRRRMTRTGWLAAAAAALVLVVGIAAITTRGGLDPVEQVLQADDRVERVLSGELGTIRVVHSADEDAVVVEGSGVAAIGPDRTYQLWLVDGEVAIPAGLFRPDDGQISARFDEIDPTGLVVAVTEEPASGSDTPTLPILASA